MATQPNWWESDTLAPANDPSFTGYIPGVPKPKDDTPSGYIKNPDGSLTPKKGGPADPYRPGGELDPNKPDTKKPQEAERTAAFLATNLTANVGLMNKALKADPSAAKPTWSQKFWGFLGEDVKNSMTPAERQAVVNSQRLITDAALTLGTGAAYTPAQLETYQRGFFPQLGDSPQAIENKREALRAALIAARTKAGNMAPKIDEAMKQLGMDPEAPLTAKPEDALTLAAAGADGKGGGGDNPPGMSELSDDQKRAVQGFLKANPDFSDEQLGSFLGTLLPGKTVTNLRDLAKHWRAGSVSTSVENLTQEERVKRRIAAEDKLGLADDPATVLAKQGSMLGISDEAAGVGNALSGVLSAPFTGRLDLVGDYRIGRDVERQRIANAREQLGYGGTAIEGISGLASAGPSALAAFSPRAAVGAAATAGALGGWGSGEGTQDSLIRGVGGGIAGAALQGVGNKAAMRLGIGGGNLAPDVAAAAERQNVSLIRPMVDEASMEKFASLKGTANAGPTIEGGANRVRGDIEAATIRLGQGGTSSNREAQGEALRTIAKTVQASDREGTTAAYTAAAQVQPDAMVDPASMRQAVDAKLQQLSLRPSQNRQEIRALQRYRADLDKPLPLQEIRNMRTDAYDNVYGGSSSRTAEQKRADRFMKGVIDGANSDIEAALTPEAYAAYKSADAIHAENRTLYKQAFKPLFGDTDGDLSKLSAEKIHDRFKLALNNNGAAIAAFHRRMPLEASRDFAATIAETLGRTGAAPDEPFDAQLFLNQTRDFSPSARNTLFGPGGAQAIDDLRLLSRKLLNTGAEKTGDATRAGYLERQSWRQLARAFLGGITNLVKGAGGATTAVASGAGYLGGGVAGAVVPATVGAGIAGGREVSRVLSARAMVNPRVAKWLAQSADITSHKAATESVRRLGTIISREPALANELTPIYDFLQGRISQPLAAQPQTEGGNGENQ